MAADAARPTPRGLPANAATARRSRLRRWWLARQPRTDLWQLTQRNVYILPTPAGFVFALTLLVMLVASINYQLNLGYLLTFLLAGSGLASMHLTHGMLRGLTLQLRTPAPAHALEPVTLEVVITSPSHARHGVGVAFDGPKHARQLAWVDVPAQGQALARLSLVPPGRGLHEVPVLRVETRHPFGLFRAWTIWRPAARVLAWPAPERPWPALPGSRPMAGEPVATRRGEQGEPDGVRAYQRGDALRQIVWKKAAHTGALVSRDVQAAVGRELWLDWAATGGSGDTEQRLSRLAAWVLRAEQQGLAYGITLTGLHLPPQQGDAHRRRVLDALALWGRP